jgi:CHAD domain-containing protein
MSYRLNIEEPMDTAVRRAAREQVEKAVDRLETGLGDDPVKAVHDARKALKKERSLLRLARGGMKPSQRRRENARLRGAAQRLGAAREADALLGALAAIDERYAGQIPEATILSVRQRLQHEREQARSQLLADDVPARVAEELRAASREADHWRLRESGWRLLSTGLEREYRRGGKAMRTAVSTPTPERMHAWRKRTKDLWYHLRLLEPIAPEILKGEAKAAHRLADRLGDLHDLAELETAIRRVQADLPADTDALIALVEHRGQQLAAEAQHLGERVYAESPKRLRRRMRCYWRAARAERRERAAARADVVAAITQHTTTA